MPSVPNVLFIFIERECNEKKNIHRLYYPAIWDVISNTCYCISSLNSINGISSLSGGNNVNNLNNLNGVCSVQTV